MARWAGRATVWRSEACCIREGARTTRQRRRRACGAILAFLAVVAVRRARLALVGTAGARYALGMAACGGESALGARRLLRAASHREVARRSLRAIARLVVVGRGRVAAAIARQGSRRALSAIVARQTIAAGRRARFVLVGPAVALLARRTLGHCERACRARRGRRSTPWAARANRAAEAIG